MAGLATARALLRLAYQGVRRRVVSSILTIVAVALGVGLVVAVGAIRESAERSFTDAARGYDVILGPRTGSPLQIALSTLFHLGEAPAKAPYEAWERVRADDRVAAAVPYAIGDTYLGHRVVATAPLLFDVLWDATGRPLGDDMRGRVFAEGSFDAVVGSEVAGATALRLGRTFSVTHGLARSGHRHDEVFTVVGVLRPTGTPNDRAIFIGLDAFYRLPGHAVAPAGPGGAGGHEAEDAHGGDGEGDDPHDEEGDDEHDEHGSGAVEAPDGRMLSAIGVRLKIPGLRPAFVQETNQGGLDVQAIHPATQVGHLMRVVGDVDAGVRIIAWLVTGVAALGVLVGLYNTIHGRRREIAVLRALGARPHHVFAVILLEALLLCFAGGLLGLLLGHGGVAAAAPTLLAEYGVRADAGPGVSDLRILGALLLLGLAAGVWPAWRGLATPVAENLHPQE